MPIYTSPVTDRYNDIGMSVIFSAGHKFATWRRLWVALAEAEKECGLNITDEQIAEMRAKISDIDMRRAAEIENETRHDVMAHLKTFAEQCPTAAPIIHLGATSCYITDNTEVLQIQEAMNHVRTLLSQTFAMLLRKADEYKDIECLAYTHFQKAQPTTVGKRFVTWAADLKSDIDALDYELKHLEFLGCKGAVGTGASFLDLFEGDTSKVYDLEEIIASKMGFSRVAEVTGQTYSRKQDFNVLQILSRIAQSASKFANDIRLLSHDGEVTEGFGTTQVGSSAMPYKKNPISCEQIVGLSRYIITGIANAAYTASTQWLERTLDDSSNRRILLPEMFILTAHVLNTYQKVLSNLGVNKEAIASRLRENAINLSCESIIAASVNNGGDRQKTHEALRKYMLSDKTTPIEEYLSGLDGVRVGAEEVRELVRTDHSGIACWQTFEFIKKYKSYGRQR